MVFSPERTGIMSLERSSRTLKLSIANPLLSNKNKLGSNVYSEGFERDPTRVNIPAPHLSSSPSIFSSTFSRR
jgi:hypothetical protein